MFWVIAPTDTRFFPKGPFATLAEARAAKDQMDELLRANRIYKLESFIVIEVAALQAQKAHIDALSARFVNEEGVSSTTE